MEVESRNLVPFCEDCTPDYKAAMLKQGRCIRPDSGFREDEDGFVAGYVPLRPSAMAKQLMERLMATPAWQREEGKNPKGGLNAKGRASAKAQGMNLKPPAPKPKTEADAARKKSFCARMGGMKKKLTSAKTANDPDSRINKALRVWGC